jgi:alkylhydroperoxidase family enzyme
VTRISEVAVPPDLAVQNNLVRATCATCATYANPDMFRGFASLSGRVHSASHLPDRIRELVVLHVTGMLGAECEWRPHARLAARHGVTDRDLEALRSGAYQHLEEPERAAIDFAAPWRTERSTTPHGRPGASSTLTSNSST